MRTIYWAGDSTVQYNSILTFPQTGMGQVMNLFLKPDIRVENHAKNGRSTKSFLDESRLAPIYDRMQEGDFLFIQFGHNDEKKQDPERYTEPEGEYTENLKKFVNAARNKNAFPVLITPLERRCFGEDGTLGDGDHGPYAEAMKKAAKQWNVPLIDLCGKSRRELRKAGPEETKKWYMHVPPNIYPHFMDGLSDDTHLKYEGAVHYAGCIAEGLKELGGIYGEILVAQE
jgi:lysophospholipase L1-like esterase